MEPVGELGALVWSDMFFGVMVNGVRLYLKTNYYYKLVNHLALLNCQKLSSGFVPPVLLILFVAVFLSARGVW